MNPHDYNLYHYTKERSTLERVIKNGFWPRYSLEDHTWLAPNLYLACPCVCFCDIPTAASSMHREDYGDYVISFDKSWKGTDSITPLLYLNENGPLAKIITEKYTREITKSGTCKNVDGKLFYEPRLLEKAKLDDIWPFLPYFKATLGHTLRKKTDEQKAHDPRPEYDHIWLTKPLEDEMEWRYVPDKHRDALYTVRDYEPKTMAALDKLNENTKDSFLKFDLADVKTVIVPTEGDRAAILNGFSALAGKVRLWSEIPQKASSTSGAQ
ncbi:hypothetical protein M2447_002735 [Ereboglobus sp. PH5-10]|uniref:abortive infection system antitoxin AbiGi family protein n=1 Tax=Ereboglobus sp. PH5-10 TaxID=2940629 RepID=UPI0024074F11|nr:abortive infection system antitoxin AbiGi family protein [Ereboglobus sp. PH5-10]MDF9828608.1 hypothetical protein [Ereboglobus sp. PH5-10]